MTKREAKRRVCDGTVKILTNGSENAWLREGLSERDARRMQEAFDELCDELLRRGREREEVGVPSSQFAAFVVKS